MMTSFGRESLLLLVMDDLIVYTTRGGVAG